MKVFLSKDVVIENCDSEVVIFPKGTLVNLIEIYSEHMFICETYVFVSLEQPKQFLVGRDEIEGGFSIGEIK